MALPFKVLPAPSSADIKIRGLHFCYAPDLAPTLDGIDLDLPVGKRVAVVGASGAGKTSLINLLLRFWDFQEGSIEMDGYDIRCYAAEDVRAQIGVISQTTYLFSTSIRQNLMLANPEASPEELDWAVEQARLRNWLSGLPEGLDTWTGEHGLQLSGGERQRVAVARTLLRMSLWFF